MVFTSNQVIGMVSCSFVLCMGLPNVTKAAEYMKPDPCSEREGGQPPPVKCYEDTQQGVHTIKGEILHMNGGNLLVKRSDGREVILHVDLSTLMSGHLNQGDRIEVKVNQVEDQKHAVAIRKIE